MCGIIEEIGFMYFAPFIVRAEHERKVPVVIERATAEDLKATAKVPKWQTDWTSEYLADEKIEKYSLKLNINF